MPSPAFKGQYPADWKSLAERVKADADGRCVRCRAAHSPSTGRCLTVHHFDGDCGNSARWNLMALCQACHLSVQGRVDPEGSLLFEPSAWSIPSMTQRSNTSPLAKIWRASRVTLLLNS